MKFSAALPLIIVLARIGSVQPQTPGPEPTPMPEPTPPPPIVGMDGDPHIKTWGKEDSWFDYHGQCDLVLLHAPNLDGHGQDLKIHVRTTIRYDYSFIEAAVVQIGQDVLEVASFGDYAVNGVDTPYLGGHAGRLSKYNITRTVKDKKRHQFDVMLGPKQNITLSTFKDIVSVSVTAGNESAKYFGDSVGIMGSYQGDLLARDGVTVMGGTNDFGQEWQVRDDEPMLFRSARAPQYPSKCVLPTASSSKAAASRRRRLGASMAKKTAEDACSHLSGVRFENCVFDVLAVGDVDIAKGMH